MSRFQTYLEQNSSIKKEITNENYSVKTSKNHGDKIIYNGNELEEFELENIAEFLNLLEKRNETISQWMHFLKNNSNISLTFIDTRITRKK